MRVRGQLTKMDSHKRHPVPRGIVVFFQLLRAVVGSLLSTVFASSGSG
jgi:hypothetical protein